MSDAEIELQEPSRPHRNHRHRAVHWAVLVFNCVVALVCFAVAGLLAFGQGELSKTQKSASIEPTDGTTRPTSPVIVTTPDSAPATTPDSATGNPDTTAVDSTEAPTTTEAFPIADPQAQNFLITGADNGACADENSTNPVDERSTLGERSDTIMVMRVDPSSSRAAILSFPRDLWVKIDGRGNNRINAAYVKNDPQKLINTIRDNFGIVIDHAIQVDFCAFKKLVDAVGGVSVYFQYPAQDKNVGLDVPVAEQCYTLNGDQALAYVRSRHYKYLDPESGKFKEDPASDYGRITRQQDFLRRAVSKIISQGFSIDVARSLIDVAQQYVVVDADLTIEKELEFAGVLRDLDPQAIQTYQVEGVGKVIGGAAVIEPRLNGDNMKAILAIFQGWSQLATAPAQVFETTTTSVPLTTTTTSTTTTVPETSSSTKSGSSSSSTTTSSGTTTTTTTTTTTVAPTTTVSPLPESNATEINKGIYPPKDKVCP